MRYPDIVCIDCGKPTATKSKRRIRCDDCIHAKDKAYGDAYRAAKIALKPPKYAPCQRCGVGTEYARTVPKYCSECRAVVRREQGREHDARRRPSLIVGSTRTCADCGEGFTVTGGKQTVCPACIAEFNRRRAEDWIDRNPERRLTAVRAYNDRNREEINRKNAEHNKLPHVKQRRREWAREYDSRPKQRIDGRMSQQIRICLSGGKSGRRWEGLVGYTVDDLYRHLESLFSPGMSWANIDLWHIDHVTPKVMFKYETAEDPQFRACWALSNLQPLWAADNLSKGTKLDYKIAA